MSNTPSPSIGWRIGCRSRSGGGSRAGIGARTAEPRGSSSSVSSVNSPPSHDFAQLLAAARERHGTVLFSDAVALDAVSHGADSLLNPHCGALANDILRYRLQPLVRVPHLVVRGIGEHWFNKETYALPLSAASPAEWVRLGDKEAEYPSALVREGEMMLTCGYMGDCSLLSLRTGRWRDGPSMPTNRFGPCSAQLGGVSVVCAGKYRDGGALSSTLLLPAGDATSWVQGCELTSARSYAGGAVVAAPDARAHRMLVAGGWDGNFSVQDPVFVKLDSCELYDAAADRWLLQEARLPQAMCCRAAPIAGGSAVLAVQCDDDENTRCALFDVRSSSPCWQPMASAERARRDHAVAAVGDDSVVMLGGSEDAGSYPPSRKDIGTAQLYDARADRWSERPEWHLPVPSASPCAVVIK